MINQTFICNLLGLSAQPVPNNVKYCVKSISTGKVLHEQIKTFLGQYLRAYYPINDHVFIYSKNTNIIFKKAWYFNTMVLYEGINKSSKKALIYAIEFNNKSLLIDIKKVLIYLQKNDA